MKQFTILILSCWLCIQQAQSQGCIVVRNISGFGQYNLTDNAFSTTDWQLNINNRFFKSYRDFKGAVDQKTPAQNEAVVKSYSMDISLSRLMRDGWSITSGLSDSGGARG